MREDRERLLDIQLAIRRIEKYSSLGRPVFEQDELVQNWMIRHLLIIGEAARALSDAFKQEHPDWSWSDIVGMRNVLVHRYFDIDKKVVWSVVENDLPVLKPKLRQALKVSKQPTSVRRKARTRKTAPERKKRKK